MTFSKLFGFGFALAVVFSAFTIAFGQYLNSENLAIQIFHYLLVFIFSIALIRRLGVINYLEAFSVMGLWFFLRILVDLIVTGPIVGYKMYASPSIWIDYLIFLLALFLFHKKRHVDIRKKLAS